MNNMKNLKHVGKIKNTGSKVLVVFRTLPGESNMALVVQTSPLSAFHSRMSLHRVTLWCSVAVQGEFVSRCQRMIDWR